MKSNFSSGDVKEHHYTVIASDIAAFQSGVVHEVMSTFALAREMEWSSRLFALELKEEDEEGIGTFLEIEHKSPALVHAELVFRAQLEVLEGNEIICTVEVLEADRIIALGKTGQKILKKDKLNQIFTSLGR